ncbi:MAG TPA: glycogen/starch/alpha-glucan phosphorylase, partial [Clostridiales bacterium]|nr:glycogen/starch/alpha-glucan phosphorylase [Clostridiales bacterium]
MTAEEVEARKITGHNPEEYYAKNATIKNAIDRLYHGINGFTFAEVANSLKTQDPYMVLADFDSYRNAQALCSEYYTDVNKWAKMSLNNIAGAGVFSADRAVNEYARDIWKL